MADKESLKKRLFEADEYSAATMDTGVLSKYSQMAVDMYTTRVVSAEEMKWMGVQKFAMQLKTGMDNYANMYYTKVLKIDLRYITVIKALISIFDTLNDPLMGIIYDKTRTRWGKARPYILATPLPFFLSTAILYCGALFFDGNPAAQNTKIFFVFITLFVQEIFSTITTLPLNNYTTLQTPNPSDRIGVSLVQSYLSAYGGDLVAGIYLPLTTLSNDGVLSISQPLLFAVLAIVTSSLGTVGTMGVAMKCPERVLLQPKPAPLSRTLFYMLKNKYAMRNYMASFFSGWWSNGGYSWDVITQMEIMGGAFKAMPFYLVYHALNALSLTLIPKFRKKFKKYKNIVILLRFWDLLLAVIWIIGGHFVIPMKKWWAAGLVFTVGYGLNGLNNAPATAFEGEINREIADYTEYLTGERADGTQGLLPNYIAKITQPLNTLFALAVIEWSGYDTTLPTTYWAQNSVDVYRKVFALYALSGFVPSLICTIPYFFYDIDGEKRDRIYKALNERRALIAKENQGKMNEDMAVLVDMISEEAGKSTK